MDPQRLSRALLVIFSILTAGVLIAAIIGTVQFSTVNKAVMTWSHTTCTVVASSCCFASCITGSGCLVYPDWLVEWPGSNGSQLGHFHGPIGYLSATDAKAAQPSYVVNSTFSCQWDPTYSNADFYVFAAGQFPNFTSYLEWMALCWVIFAVLVAAVIVTALRGWPSNRSCDDLCRRGPRRAKPRTPRSASEWEAEVEKDGGTTKLVL